MNHVKAKQIALALLILLMVSVMVLTTVYLPGENLSFDTEPAAVLSTEWQLEQPDGGTISLSLPTKLGEEQSGPVVLSCTLPEQFPSGITLLIRSSLQTVEVFVGESQTPLYQRGLDRPDYTGAMIGSCWNLVRLPDDAVGQKLTLVLDCPYEGQADMVNQVYYGSRSALLFYIVHNYGLALVCALLVLGTCVFLLVLGVVTRAREIWYLGLFDLFVGLWILGESKMLQLFTGNPYVLINLPFFALFMIPIPFVRYLEYAYEPHRRRFTGVMYWVYVAVAAGATLAQVFNIADMFTMLPLAHVAILVGAVLVTASLVFETVRWHNRDALRVLGPSLVLMVSGAAELYNFYTGDLTTVSSALSSGMLLFIFLLAVFSIKRFLNLLDKTREAKYFRRLAYQDMLTGCENRTAYYEQVQRKFGLLAGRRNHWLVLWDINNLKVINDEFGHATGDEALCLAAECMRRVFGEMGSLYRIGGDEFAASVCGLDEAAFARLMERFEAEIKAAGLGKSYPFEIAAGFGCYDPDQYENFEAFSREVDHRMYYSKKRMKNPQEV